MDLSSTLAAHASQVLIAKRTVEFEIRQINGQFGGHRVLFVNSLFWPEHFVEKRVGSKASRSLPQSIARTRILDVVTGHHPFPGLQAAEAHGWPLAETGQPFALPFG